MKIGKVSIIGKPNVGKSTFLNTILNKKQAIISPKPQTTRNNIKGLYNDEQSQIIFIDTPGFHKAKNKLDLFLNANVKSAINEADLFLFLTDPGRQLDEEDFNLLNFIKNKASQSIVILTKSDLYDQQIIDERIAQIQEIFKPLNIFSISALTKHNIVQLLDYLKQNLVVSDFKLVEDDSLELDDKFIISEIIREQIIFLLRQEIPYGCAVTIDKMSYDNEKNLLSIYASIIVEKQSQKPILIGAKAKMIKQIGINARKELLKIYNCKIFLDLNVKIKKNWRDNELQIKNLGYKKQ